MDTIFDQLQNTQRIRYEAFATLATEINKSDCIAGIARSVGGHLKFILDSYIFRVYYQFDDTVITLRLFRGECVFQEGTIDLLTGIERDIFARGLPLTLSQPEIDASGMLTGTPLDHPNVNFVAALPQQGIRYRIVVTNALRQDNGSHDIDFKFLGMISDLIGNKLSQLVLIRQIADKQRELEHKNQEVRLLNRTLEEKVRLRTFELQQTNEELQTLFYHASHDFRTPLTNISGLITIGEMLADNTEMIVLFDRCKTSIAGLDKMLRRINTMCSLEFDKNLEILGAVEIITELKQKFSDELTTGRLTLQTTCSAQTTFVSHRNMLLCILENLLDNVICFCPVNPEAFLEIRVTDRTTRITITDNGPGIHPKIARYVFDMYYRGSNLSKGPGLGLYIVKKLIKSLSGSIRVKTRPGAGTTFEITLPKL
jgi:signal transduction histidine kinase